MDHKKIKISVFSKAPIDEKKATLKFTGQERQELIEKEIKLEQELVPSIDEITTGKYAIRFDESSEKKDRYCISIYAENVKNYKTIKRIGSSLNLC